MTRIALILAATMTLAAPVVADTMTMLVPALSFPDGTVTPSTKDCVETTAPKSCPPQD